MISSKNSNTKYFFNNQERTIELKSNQELDKLRKAGQSVAKILNKLQDAIKPGVTTQYVDDLAFNEIRSLKMKPAFLGYRGYPSTICISINNELVHGIPRSNKVINDGDIVSIDLGLIYDGFYGDMAITFSVGKITKDIQNLLDITKQSLYLGIEQVKPGNRLGDVSWAVQKYVEKAGYSIVRDYVGHGIGRNLHEEPPVPNFGKPHTGPRLVSGMVIAIEPMVNAGGFQVKTLGDGWTVVTADGKLCAHFEHMVAVNDNGYEILTEI